MKRLVAVLLAISMVVSACSADGGSSQAVVVMAASSLVDVVDAIDGSVPNAEVDPTPIEIRATYAGSSSLVAQLRDGAPADLLITASRSTMATAVDGATVQGEPVLLARNQLVLAVADGNPGEVTSLVDLADPAKVIGLCAPEVPCGALAARALSSLDIEARASTFEPNVRSLANKIRLGELDAGLVYRTDAFSLGLTTINAPELDNFSTEYMIASISAHPATPVVRFIRYITTSDEAHKLLTDQGFVLP